MSDIKPLELTIQDLPMEIKLDLSEAGSDALSDAIQSLQSEIQYNSRFDESTTGQVVQADVIQQDNQIFTIRLSAQQSVA